MRERFNLILLFLGIALSPSLIMWQAHEISKTYCSEGMDFLG